MPSIHSGVGPLDTRFITWISLGIALFAYAVSFLVKRGRRPSFPYVMAGEGLPKDALAEARSKYPNQPFYFQAPNSPEVIVLPHRVYDELKSMPEEKISFSRFTHESFMTRYTEAQVSHALVSAVKVDLTRNIAKVLHELQEEVAFVFDRDIASCPTWKPYPVYDGVLKTVAALSSRTFVGLPLCRDQEWIKASIEFTLSVMGAIRAIKKWHPLLRPIVAPFLPALRDLYAYKAFGRKKLKPQMDASLKRTKVKADLKLSHQQGDNEALNNEFNLINWILQYADEKSANATEMGHEQMMASFAAVHTTGLATTHLLFDLASHPEYIPELREEIDAAMAEEQQSGHRLSKSSLPKLKKMDSLMKESQRLAPPSILTLNRKVVSPGGIALSTGDHIPAGSYISLGHPYFPLAPVLPGAPLTAASQPPLETFAPWRYLNLRTAASGQEGKHQFVSVTSDSVTFGAGPGACPGRFFAANEIKVILVEILQRYDLALGPGGEGEGMRGFRRPANISYGLDYSPDHQAVIYLRDRQ